VAEVQLLLTQAERDRLVALKKAKKKLIAQKQAAEELGITERHVRRLPRELKRRGDKVVAHRPLEKQHDLAAILSHVEKRRVNAGYTFPLDAKTHRILRQDICTGLRGAYIRVAALARTFLRCMPA